MMAEFFWNSSHKCVRTPKIDVLILSGGVNSNQAKKSKKSEKKKIHVENDSVEVTNDEQELSPKKRKNSVKN